MKPISDWNPANRQNRRTLMKFRTTSPMFLVATILKQLSRSFRKIQLLGKNAEATYASAYEFMLFWASDRKKIRVCRAFHAKCLWGRACIPFCKAGKSEGSKVCEAQIKILKAKNSLSLSPVALAWSSKLQPAVRDQRAYTRMHEMKSRSPL